MKWYAYVSIMLGPVQIFICECVLIVQSISISFVTAGKYENALIGKRCLHCWPFARKIHQLPGDFPYVGANSAHVGRGLG